MSWTEGNGCWLWQEQLSECEEVEEYETELGCTLSMLRPPAGVT